MKLDDFQEARKAILALRKWKVVILVLSDLEPDLLIHSRRC